MTGPEMLAQIAEYYEQKEHEHPVECMWFTIKLNAIVVCLISIARSLYKLWRAFEI